LLLPFELVRKVVIDALRRSGASQTSAELQGDVLVEADMRGHPSHGIQRLPRLISRISRQLAIANTTGLHVWRSGSYLSVDGGRGLGPVIGAGVIDALAPAARSHGVAIAAVRDTNHLGMLAWYAERIADLGLIGIVLSTSEALVHPWGGRRAMLGTNPIAIGIPAPPEASFVLDLATSTVSMGKIADHALRGHPIPDDWALDEAGHATTDPAAARRGSLTPFGGAKGYGLGLAIELLVASLSGSDFAPDVHGTLDDEHPCNKGDVFIVVDPSARSGRSIASYLTAVRASPSTSPDRPVAVPGDGARSRRRFALEHGIEIDRTVWDEVTSLAVQAA